MLLGGEAEDAIDLCKIWCDESPDSVIFTRYTSGLVMSGRLYVQCMARQLQLQTESRMEIQGDSVDQAVAHDDDYLLLLEDEWMEGCLNLFKKDPLCSLSLSLQPFHAVLHQKLGATLYKPHAPHHTCSTFGKR